MKRLGVPFLILLFSLSILSAPEALHAAIKIGYIDSEILRERMPEFQQIERELERLKQQYEQEAMDRQSKLIKLQEDFQKQELLLSDTKKAEMQVEFEEAVRQLQEFTQEKLGPNGEIFRKNIDLSSPVFEQVNTALDIVAIKKIIPHRYPLLLVERIIEMVPGERVVGLKSVTGNEPFFEGHFPAYPVMPGVLIIEALAQTGAVMMLQESEVQIPFLAGID